MSPSDFPDVDPGAISTLASELELISSAFADVGLGSENLRDALIKNEQWQGEASKQWQAVVTERIGDAGLSNEVMGTAATKLAALASDLQSERRTYDRISEEILQKQSTIFDPYGLPPPELADPVGYQALCRSVARANDLLDQAAKGLLGLAVLAGDIRAQPAANRMPGVPDGTDRRVASLKLLATLFGSVRDNQLSGAEFEKTVLQELGITKNTEVWRPDPPFEGKITLTGLAKGTTPDGQGSNFLLEVKGTNSQTVRYQLRLEAEYARQSGRPLWIIKQGSKRVTGNLQDLAERTGGGVLYRTGTGTYTDGNGNPVQVTYDKNTDSLHVQGYTRQPGSGGGTAPTSIGPPDADTPSEPVDPQIADGDTDGAAVDPVDPADPGPVDPVDPIDPIDPFIP